MAKSNKKSQQSASELDEAAYELRKVLDGFDPHNNAQDRLILYEVTGMRTSLKELRYGESSESEEDLTVDLFSA